MRALIVGTLAIRDPELVSELASGCDTVIAADGGGAACLAAGVNPAVVVGDLDSLRPEDAVRLTAIGSKLVTVPAEKDETDLDLALGAARPAGASEVWITGVFGERLDHTLASVGSVCRCADLSPRIVEPDLAAWVLGHDGRPRLHVEGEGALVSIFAVGAPAATTCSGLRYPLWAEVLRPLDSRGLSNVITEREAIIEVLEGVLLVCSVSTNGVAPAREVVPGHDIR